MTDEIGLKARFWNTATVNARLAGTFSAQDRGTAAIVLSALVGEVPGADQEAADLATCRLMLAAIKVSDGSIAKLSLWVEAARNDPRDLMAAAEYPRELGGGGDEARDADLAEYLSWASAGAGPLPA